jgi:hypothetical protein
VTLSNTLKVLSGGFRTGWWFYVDSDGYFAGTTGSLVPGATGQAGYYLDGVKSAAYKSVEPLVLLATGEDQPLGQIVEPPQTFPNFDITGSIGDLTLDGLQQNTITMNQGNATFGVIQPYLPNYLDGGLLLMRLAISRDAATLGAGNWDGVLFPKVKMVPMSSNGMKEKSISDFMRHAICNPSTIMPNGIPVNATNFQTTNSIEFPFTSPSKLMYFGWRGTGAVTAFNLPKTSIPGSNLLATGYPNYTTSEGVVVTPVVTLVGSSYVFTFSPAPANNARVIALVEYQ